MITLYHNPRCSKSRDALERVKQFASAHAVSLNVVDYQKMPLTLAQLQALHYTLQSEGALRVREMVRDGEQIFALLHLDQADDDALFAALAAHPVLLQRPIVTYMGRGIIARPPELVERILSK